MTTTIKRKVTDDQVITTTVTIQAQNRRVKFDDILDVIKVRYDEDYCDAPWECCDGLEHEYNRATSYDHPGVEDSRGYGYCGARRECFVIEILDDTLENWGNYEYFHNNGCSKQVARELVAQIKRNTLDQLVKWYTEGWYWYAVCGQFEGYQVAVTGLGFDDAETMRSEIADEIAHSMEKDGFIVEGRPCALSRSEQFKTAREYKKRAFLIR